MLVGIVGDVVGAGAGGAAALIGNWAFVKVITFAVKVVVGAFGAVLSAVVYHDLRVSKEGVDIDTIASVFD